MAALPEGVVRESWPRRHGQARGEGIPATPVRARAASPLKSAAPLPAELACPREGGEPP